MWEYIKWGEAQGFHRKSGTKTRKPWYVLPKQALTGGEIIWPCRAGQRHIVAYNPKRIISHRFYRIHYSDDAKVFAAYLNSSFVAMCAEVFAGAALGQGVLDLTKPTIAEIPVIDCSRLQRKEALSLCQHLDNLSTEPTTSLLTQCGYDKGTSKCRDENGVSHARLELDLTVGHILGLSETETRHVREIACNLIDNRYSKAQSVG